ncbi:MAG: hypothetical protein A2878_00795 [Candidatus Moranbacteria bacterium RIFCSPHIGHO2_01_FULL_54_31]|nr:MAG: hypothetical protein A2878_00795 [Candidatus Moranbacteria bacterium RIFCSPHIGHO2_01_FULL_54_31]
METFLQDILSFLLLYKYAALFAITFLAAFALPLPSTTSVVTAAGFASQDYLNIWWVVFFATLGNVLADNLVYWGMRAFGYSIFRRLGFRKVVESPLFAALSERLQEHSSVIIFFSRFQVLATLSVNFLAGFAKTDYRKFFWYGLAGEAAQVTMFASIGYFFGSNWEGILALFGEFTLILIACTIVLIILFRKRLVRSLLKGRK